MKSKEQLKTMTIDELKVESEKHYNHYKLIDTLVYFKERWEE